MKKILLMLVAVLGFSFAANAQQGTCKVSGGNGATVVVTVVDWDEEGNVELSVGSDCDDYVNVSFTLSYNQKTSGGGHMNGVYESQPFGLTVAPNQSNTKTVTIRMGSGKLSRVNSLNISSARCE